MAIEYIPCAHNDNKGEQITRNFLIDSLAGTDGILRELLSKLLDSDPDRRPQRAQAVKRWLEQI
jgi:hypothetical protein